MHPRTDIVVLCYHGVSDHWPAETAVTPRELRSQVEALLARGYTPMTLADALTAPEGRRILAVTFDDANRSIGELGRPVLDALGVPATVYVPTDYAGTDRVMGWPGFERWVGTEHEQELLCLSWDALRELADSGWEIGSHTCSHPFLTRLAPSALDDELQRSKRILEQQLDRPCVSLAYPYSDENAEVVRAARRAGYALAVTVAQHPETPLPLRWPRVALGLGDTPQQLRVRIARRRNAAVDAGAGAALAIGRRARSALRG